MKQSEIILTYVCFGNRNLGKKLQFGVKSKEAGNIMLNIVTSYTVLHPEGGKGRLWITMCNFTLFCVKLREQ